MIRLTLWQLLRNNFLVIYCHVSGCLFWLAFRGTLPREVARLEYEFLFHMA